MVVCVFFASLLPLITVWMFAEERKKGVDRFVKALPISARELVMGKLLASGLLLLVLSVFLLLVPIFLGLWGAVYYPSAYMAIFSFFLFALAMLAIDSFLALVIRNYWVAMGVSYAVTVGMFLLYYLSRFLPEPFSLLLSRFSVFGSYSLFVFGILDLGAIGLYFSLIALFTFLTLLFAKKVWKE